MYYNNFLFFFFKEIKSLRYWLKNVCLSGYILNSTLPCRRAGRSLSCVKLGLLASLLFHLQQEQGYFAVLSVFSSTHLLYTHPCQIDFPKTQVLSCHHSPNILSNSSLLLLDWSLNISISLSRLCATWFQMSHLLHTDPCSGFLLP